MTTKITTTQSIRKDIKPQLCKLYNPKKHDWSHPWIVEPKFDGLRCIVIVEMINKNRTITAYSRNGRPLWNMGFILDELKSLIPENECNIVLDGEVYTKDWNLSMGIVKSSITVHPDSDKLRFHVWDYVPLNDWKAGISNVSNQDRKKKLSSLLGTGGTKVQLVTGVIVTNDKELQKAYQEFLDLGYEGIIVKNPKGVYKCKHKSPNWLKLKPWSDADLTVIGSYPGEGKHVGRIGGLILRGKVDWGGRRFAVETEVGTGFTDDERESFQKMVDSNTLNGNIVEIKFQSIAEDTGACRFPVYSRLREDKK